MLNDCVLGRVISTLRVISFNNQLALLIATCVDKYTGPRLQESVHCHTTGPWHTWNLNSSYLTQKKKKKKKISFHYTVLMSTVPGP